MLCPTVHTRYRLIVGCTYLLMAECLAATEIFTVLKEMLHSGSATLPYMDVYVQNVV